MGWKRQELKAGKLGDLFDFINKQLLPYLHALDIMPGGQPNPSASPKQRVIGRIMTAAERVRVDDETVGASARLGASIDFAFVNYTLPRGNR